MSYQIIFTDSLSHHGIKGQRWGVRRYRLEDGSLTSEGRKRYLNAKETYKALKKTKPGSYDTYLAKQNLKKSKDLMKRAKRADKGLKLYQHGKTITDNEYKMAVRRRAVGGILSVGSAITSAAFMYEYLEGKKKIPVKNFNLSLTQAAGLATTGAAALAGLGVAPVNIYNRAENRNMRSYWHRGQDVKDLNKNKSGNYGG